jgi:hypothetical protein
MRRYANTGWVLPILCAVDRLGLDGGVPPGIEEEDVSGGGQVEPGAAGAQADQEDPTRTVALEPRHALLAVAGLAIQVLVPDARHVEPGPHQRQQRGERREHQRLVARRGHLGDLREQRVELGAAVGGPPLVDEARVRPG